MHLSCRQRPRNRQLPESKVAILQTAGAATVKRIKDLNIGLKYICYQEEGTGKTQEIVITPEEIIQPHPAATGLRDCLKSIERI